VHPLSPTHPLLPHPPPHRCHCHSPSRLTAAAPTTPAPCPWAPAWSVPRHREVRKGRGYSSQGVGAQESPAPCRDPQAPRAAAPSPSAVPPVGSLCAGPASPGSAASGHAPGPAVEHQGRLLPHGAPSPATLRALADLALLPRRRLRARLRQGGLARRPPKRPLAEPPWAHAEGHQHPPSPAWCRCQLELLLLRLIHRLRTAPQETRRGSTATQLNRTATDASSLRQSVPCPGVSVD